MRNFEKYYDFIKDEDTRKAVKKIADKANYVSKNFAPATTDFINPFVAKASIPMINNFNLNFKLFPSSEYCERKILILCPEYWEDIDCGDYIMGIRINNKSKFKALNHRDFLGAMMSLGIDRNKTGDIYVYEDYADIVLCADIADYVIYNLDKIGNNKVEVDRIDINKMNFKEQEHVVINITSTSMRLDNVVKHLANKSREVASSMIKSNDVKINWQVIDKTSHIVEENDMISISKYGRFKVSKLLGMTKSGKNKVEIKHYV